MQWSCSVEETLSYRTPCWQLTVAVALPFVFSIMVYNAPCDSDSFFAKESWAPRCVCADASQRSGDLLCTGPGCRSACMLLLVAAICRATPGRRAVLSNRASRYMCCSSTGLSRDDALWCLVSCCVLSAVTLSTNNGCAAPKACGISIYICAGTAVWGQAVMVPARHLPICWSCYLFFLSCTAMLVNRCE